MGWKATLEECLSRDLEHTLKNIYKIGIWFMQQAAPQEGSSERPRMCPSAEAWGTGSVRKEVTFLSTCQLTHKQPIP